MRQLDVGATLRETFELYRDQAGLLMPVAFWLFLAGAIANGLTEGELSLFWVSMVISLAVEALFEGMVVGLVRDVREGRGEVSVRDLIRTVLPVLGRLLGAGVLYGLGIAGGTLLLIVPGLYLLTIWTAVSPVIVIERLRVFDAFGRSRKLVQDNGWHVFWVIVLTTAITIAAFLAFTAIATSIADGPIIRAVFSALASTLTAPFGALVTAVIYFRLLAIEGEAKPAAEATAAAPRAP